MTTKKQKNEISFFLNGEITYIANNTTLALLIKNLELDPKKIAIEKDLKIINPQDFDKIIIDNNCRIEIVHFIGGG